MPSRRRALRLAGGAATAASASVLLPSPADAAPRRAAPDRPRTLEEDDARQSRKRRRKYRPARYRATPVLSVQSRHLVNRFSFGITPQLAAEVRAAGGHLAWFDRQLATPYDARARGLADWWPDLHLSAAAIFKRQTMLDRDTLEVGYDIGKRTVVRRIVSPTPVLEVMTKFWENLLHVPIAADNVSVFRADYGEQIRARALGRYDDLLKTAVLHPAMLMYLGNAGSTKAHPNENLGRELLELHTLGVGHHTEDDVKASARILTGWRVKLYSTWEPFYSEVDHWTGPVRVRDFVDDNVAADGRDLTLRFLSYLSHHPDTARRIATKLVRTFVSDQAPKALVERLAAVYLANDTQIRPVLRTLVRSPDFKKAVDQKVRDADEDVAASYRLLGARISRPRSDFSAANQVYWQVAGLGLAPLTWPRPDGPPLDNAAWSTATRVLASVSLHWEMAGGWPEDDVTFARRTSYLPQKEMAFRKFVDHLSRVLLQRPSTEDLLHACCLATGYRPTTRVTKRSDLFRGRWQKLMTTFLDSPAYYRH
ncbi:MULTISPECIES: DUF1800 domain-containing protein [unclassified Nocardioides]|uniref:DUF1800 domain-containing protein n=1 Tax=unclassified Nocardioides TaxID=2615069 RepID=UPI0030141FE9